MPDDFGSEEQIALGKIRYNRSCGACHGGDAFGNGLLPDLRHSAIANDPDAWRSVVIDGAFVDKGMVSFAAVLTEADAEAIRAFVARQANTADTQ